MGVQPLLLRALFLATPASLGPSPAPVAHVAPVTTVAHTAQAAGRKRLSVAWRTAQRNLAGSLEQVPGAAGSSCVLPQTGGAWSQGAPGPALLPPGWGLAYRGVFSLGQWKGSHGAPPLAVCPVVGTHGAFLKELGGFQMFF